MPLVFWFEIVCKTAYTKTHNLTEFIIYYLDYNRAQNLLIRCERKIQHKLLFHDFEQTE